ncbi:hypothetical protein RJ639_024596, partial [Escallonia herrerae]
LEIDSAAPGRTTTPVGCERVAVASPFCRLKLVNYVGGIRTELESTEKKTEDRSGEGERQRERMRFSFFIAWVVGNKSGNLLTFDASVIDGACGTSSLIRDLRSILRLVMLENLDKTSIKLGEMHGLLNGLLGVERENIFPLQAFGDSSTAMSNFNNQKISPPLVCMGEKIQSRINKDGIIVKHKLRKFNTAADHLVHEALDLTKGHKVERADDMSSKLIKDCWMDKYVPSKVIDTTKMIMPMVMELSDNLKFRKWLDTCN